MKLDSFQSTAVKLSMDGDVNSIGNGYSMIVHFKISESVLLNYIQCCKSKSPLCKKKEVKG